MPRPNWKNRTLYHGDNLVFMRSMNSGSVHLIATDPPFNKGRDFHATPESLAKGASFQDRWRWDEDVHPEWIEQIQDDWPGVWAVIDWTRMVHSDAMGAFLAFMAVRLMAMHRVLREDGSIYLHCDPTAGAYLKTLMDAVFGPECFRSEIVWKRTAGRSDAKGYGKVHDTILYYARNGATWNPQHLPHDEGYVARAYRHRDERGRWRAADLMAAGTRQGESGEPWRGVDPNTRGNHWRTPTAGGMNDFIREHRLIPGWPDALPSLHARLDALDAAGLVHWPKKEGGTPCLKRYLASTKGIAVEDVVTDINRLEANSKENTDYPTQKPLALYRRIIRASSNEDDIVLDPFAGCATTPVAAELEGRQWLAADLWDGAHQVVLDRLARDIEAETGQKGQIDFLRKEVHLRREPLARTDDGETAAPALRSLARRAAPPSMKRQEMVEALVAEHGIMCLGCGRTFDSTRYLELDHQIPRSDGGSNELSNRVLLCSPCNRTKSNTLTLSGLRKENRRTGFLRS